MTDTAWAARGACKKDPDLWFDAAPDARRLAIHICKSHCPVRDRCAGSEIAGAYAVQAGVVYTRFGDPSDQQPKPSSANCVDCGATRITELGARKPTSQFADCGTNRAYRRHIGRGERSCQPCSEAKNKYQREKRAAQRTTKPGVDGQGQVAA